MSPSDEIRLGCRRILLRGLTLPCAIGAYERERGRLQKVAFEADVWVRRPENAREDVLDDVLNYDLIVEAIRNEAARGHVDLQETLVERIARHLHRASRGGARSGAEHEARSLSRRPDRRRNLAPRRRRAPSLRNIPAPS